MTRRMKCELVRLPQFCQIASCYFAMPKMTQTSSFPGSCVVEARPETV